MKHVPPTVKETSFNCPHCGALAKQFWFDIWAQPNNDERPLPIIVGEGGADEFNFKDIDDDELKIQLTDWANKMAKGVPFLETKKEGRSAVPTRPQP